MGDNTASEQPADKREQLWNCVWMHHFGTPLVATPGDSFGHAASQPLTRSCLISFASTLHPGRLVDWACWTRRIDGAG